MRFHVGQVTSAWAPSSVQPLLPVQELEPAPIQGSTTAFPTAPTPETPPFSAPPPKEPTGSPVPTQRWTDVVKDNLVPIGLLATLGYLGWRMFR